MLQFVAHLSSCYLFVTSLLPLCYLDVTCLLLDCYLLLVILPCFMINNISLFYYLFIFSRIIALIILRYITMTLLSDNIKITMR